MRLEGVKAESLYDELSRLRKNEGFIERRLISTSIARQILRRDETDTFLRLQSRLISAIHTLDEPDADLLLDVFALSPDTAGVLTLKQRREIHGHKIRRGIDTVASREKAAVSILCSHLLRGDYAQSPLVLHVPEMHGGIIYEQVSVGIVIKDGLWRGTQEYYRFVNMAQDPEYVTIGRSYPAVVAPDPHGAFKVNTRSDNRTGWDDNFWHLNKTRTHTEPMRYGEIYDLKFTLTPEPGEDDKRLKLIERILHERALLFTLQTKFIGKKPAVIWKYEQVSPRTIPTAPTQYNTINLDDKDTAAIRLRDVYGGRANGIAWQW